MAQNGNNSKQTCQVAPDLPSLMVICGIFAVFFLSAAYGFLNMNSSIRKYQSDVSETTSKILIGFISFIFGALTIIFFTIKQIRVYVSYSKGVEFNNKSVYNYCEPTIMRAALAMIILTYINMLVFIGIFVFIIVHTRNKLHEGKEADIENVVDNMSYRFYEVTQRK
ncbi:unnamed protein product [Rotaria sp. Silwood1]|nr:unnamed protein product [Rotaria sp. Silwood1]CAF1410111.1 unnamed protein product [Rotaria sp. Silwood1]CAF1411385.1 unnamed protein product [Rotaria sp. Silwood1]CAF3528998.1 unnamed protein product [Rotaria sp. Silwood1]CAF3613425.1 unnamed protein product [Rotaria sp. Silwood1]